MRVSDLCVCVQDTGPLTMVIWGRGGREGDFFVNGTKPAPTARVFLRIHMIWSFSLSC